MSLNSSDNLHFDAVYCRPEYQHFYNLPSLISLSPPPRPSPLQTAPLVILFEIFLHLPTISDAANFSQTCHNIYDVWATYNSSISLQLIQKDPRVTYEGSPGVQEWPVLKFAQELSRVQQAGLREPEDALATAKRQLSNANEVKSIVAHLYPIFHAYRLRCKPWSNYIQRGRIYHHVTISLSHWDEQGWMMLVQGIYKLWIAWLKGTTRYLHQKASRTSPPAPGNPVVVATMLEYLTGLPRMDMEGFPKLPKGFEWEPVGKDKVILSRIAHDLVRVADEVARGVYVKAKEEGDE